ncbi:hypothetical protein AURDEDRAFT_184719 [Auricularia subglabra TFB-10046 SS5]|nr:hypothetical protein AURDEDRAFT_184719 [Auricularia subglabra TFB-10046 SS5]
MHPHTAAPCYPPKRRTRGPPSHCQQSSPASPLGRAPSASAPSRWLCPMPFCARSYGRPHDLVRHLDAAHHAELCATDDALLAALGVPVEHVARLRTLMARRNRCAVCGAAFPRRDTLLRHLDEQGHRLVSVSAPALTPVPAGFPLPATSGGSSPNPGPALAVAEMDWTSQFSGLSCPAPSPVPVTGEPTLFPPPTVEPVVAGGENFAWDPEFLRLLGDPFGLSL